MLRAIISKSYILAAREDAIAESDLFLFFATYFADPAVSAETIDFKLFF